MTDKRTENIELSEDEQKELASFYENQILQERLANKNQDNEKAAKKRERTTIEVPDVKEGATVYDYIVAAGMERRMLDIALAQGECEASLKPEAEQEVRLEWSMREADLSLSPSQVLSYASLMAKHTVLRVRRDLGSPVRLPGSAFRKKSDGSTYVSVGVLAPSLSMDEVEGWFDFTDGHLDPDFARDYLPGRDGNPEELHDAWHSDTIQLETEPGEAAEESKEQKQVISLANKGFSIEEIAKKTGFDPDIVKAFLSHHALAERTRIVTEAYGLIRSGSCTYEEAAQKFDVPVEWLAGELKLLAEGVALESMAQAREHDVFRKRREVLNQTKDLVRNNDIFHALELLTNGVKLLTIYKTLGISVKDRDAFHKELTETAKRMRKSAGLQRTRSGD